jgi:hypothetical protein
MLLSTRDDAPSAGRLTLIKTGTAVALAVAIALLWWRPWHPHVKVPSVVPPAASVEAAPVDKPIESGILSNASAAPVTPEAATPTLAADPGTSISADAPAAPVPGAGRARLRLSFSADSWVDIHDASGKRTFAGNGLANSVKTLSGTAPLRVYLGVGSGVQLEINDRAVAIGPQFFAGDVARFEAGADGVLRRDSHPDQTHGAPPRSPRPPG